jgi:hypothetical protein
MSANPRTVFLLDFAILRIGGTPRGVDEELRKL